MSMVQACSAEGRLQLLTTSSFEVYSAERIHSDRTPSKGLMEPMNDVNATNAPLPFQVLSMHKLGSLRLCSQWNGSMLRRIRT